MGGSCNTHGRGEKYVQNFNRKIRKAAHSEDDAVDGRRCGSIKGVELLD
jgi:hypothetical protein